MRGSRSRGRSPTCRAPPRTTRSRTRRARPGRCTSPPTRIAAPSRPRWPRRSPRPIWPASTCARCPSIRARSIREPGLLYLPRPYVVPGGRFNEMYGWDSYFIVLGLLRDDKVALARDMVDDFIYEVRHYGGVLNANRTYYLTRSQPPLLSAMVLAVYRATHDRAWLAGTRDALARRVRALDLTAAPDPRARALALLRSRRRPGARGGRRRARRRGPQPLRSRAGLVSRPPRRGRRVLSAQRPTS